MIDRQVEAFEPYVVNLSDRMKDPKMIYECNKEPSKQAMYPWLASGLLERTTKGPPSAEALSDPFGSDRPIPHLAG
jgi:hypothetical protein